MFHTYDEYEDYLECERKAEEREAYLEEQADLFWNDREDDDYE